MKGFLLVFLIPWASYIGEAQVQPADSFTIDIRSVGVIRDSVQVLGTGFIVGDNYTILTCDHLFDRYTGGQLTFKVYGISLDFIIYLTHRNSQLDLAILHCDLPITSTPLTVNSTDTIALGSQIQYIGYDDIESKKENQTMLMINKGRIIGKGQMKENQINTDFFEFKGHSIPGYSGSPIFNNIGEVIGVLSQGFVRVGHKDKMGVNITRAVSLKAVVIQN